MSHRSLSPNLNALRSGVSPAVERVPGAVFHSLEMETPKLNLSDCPEPFITSSSEQEEHIARLTHAATSMPALHPDFNRVVISLYICFFFVQSTRVPCHCGRKGNIQPRPACNRVVRAPCDAYSDRLMDEKWCLTLRRHHFLSVLVIRGFFQVRGSRCVSHPKTGSYAFGLSISIS